MDFARLMVIVAVRSLGAAWLCVWQLLGALIGGILSGVVGTDSIAAHVVFVALGVAMSAYLAAVALVRLSAGSRFSAWLMAGVAAPGFCLALLVLARGGHNDLLAPIGTVVCGFTTSFLATHAIPNGSLISRFSLTAR
jgi:hypothetical protein